MPVNMMLVGAFLTSGMIMLLLSVQTKYNQSRQRTR